MPLTARNIQIVDRASAHEMRNVYSTLKLPNGLPSWLPRQNPYGNSFVSAVTKLHTSTKRKDSRLVRAIAASAPLHLMDAWAYFSGASTAAVHGNTALARHLAYYAELRAAMSLLATLGVAVGNRQHVVVENGGQLQIITGTGTHDFAWDALEHISTKTDPARIFCDSFRVGGRGLTDWLNDCGLSIGATASFENLIKTWGFDLASFREDRDSRNEMSYRPRFSLSEVVTPGEANRRLQQLWQLAEPSTSAFDLLDRIITRRILKQLARASWGTRHNVKLQAAFNLLESHGKLSRSLNEFLQQAETDNEIEVLAAAHQRDDHRTPGQYAQMIARAFLLIRLSSVFVSRLMSSSGHSLIDLSAWWQQIGTTKGVWERSIAVGNPLELWPDVETSLESLRTWMDETPRTCLAQLRRENGASLDRVLGFDALGLMALV